MARRIAGRLRPPIGEEYGITLGIEYIICELQGQDGPEIAFEVKGEVGRFAPALESAVLRIVKELLTNTRCHSGSEKVRLEVARDAERLQLEIEDWGTGFDVKQASGTGLGLQEVHQCARLLDGSVIVDSVPGKGTRVVVSFPVGDIPREVPQGQ